MAFNRATKGEPSYLTQARAAIANFASPQSEWSDIASPTPRLPQDSHSLSSFSRSHASSDSKSSRSINDTSYSHSTHDDVLVSALDIAAKFQREMLMAGEDARSVVSYGSSHSSTERSSTGRSAISPPLPHPIKRYDTTTTLPGPSLDDVGTSAMHVGELISEEKKPQSTDVWDEELAAAESREDKATNKLENVATDISNATGISDDNESLPSVHTPKLNRDTDLNAMSQSEFVGIGRPENSNLVVIRQLAETVRQQAEDLQRTIQLQTLPNATVKDYPTTKTPGRLLYDSPLKPHIDRLDNIGNEIRQRSVEIAAMKAKFTSEPPDAIDVATKNSPIDVRVGKNSSLASPLMIGPALERYDRIVAERKRRHFVPPSSDTIARWATCTDALIRAINDLGRSMPFSHTSLMAAPSARPYAITGHAGDQASPQPNVHYQRLIESICSYVGVNLDRIDADLLPKIAAVVAAANETAVQDRITQRLKQLRPETRSTATSHTSSPATVRDVSNVPSARSSPVLMRAYQQINESQYLLEKTKV